MARNTGRTLLMVSLVLSRQPSHATNGATTSPRKQSFSGFPDAPHLHRRNGITLSGREPAQTPSPCASSPIVPLHRMHFSFTLYPPMLHDGPWPAPRPHPGRGQLLTFPLPSPEVRSTPRDS